MRYEFEVGGGGGYIWRGDLTEVFLRYEFGGGAYIWRGLNMEALIFRILRYLLPLGCCRRFHCQQKYTQDGFPLFLRFSFSFSGFSLSFSSVHLLHGNCTVTKTVIYFTHLGKWNHLSITILQFWLIS